MGRAGWLFPNEAGHPFDIKKVASVFHRYRKRAALPRFRLYDLRHTYASLLLAAGVPITYVSAQLGHANPTTTLRYYARWIPSQGQRWVALLDRFGSKLEPKVEPKRRFVGVDDPQLVEKVGSPSSTRIELYAWPQRRHFVVFLRICGRHAKWQAGRRSSPSLPGLSTPATPEGC